MTTSRLSALTETVGEVVSSGAGAVQEAASSAASLAADAASTALEEIPERIAGLAEAARERISPKKRSRRPWLLIGLVVALVVTTVWWWRRRPNSTPAVDTGIDGGANPVRAHADQALAAAT